MFKKSNKENTSIVSTSFRILDILNIIVSGILAFACRYKSFLLNIETQAALSYAVTVGLIIFPLGGLYHTWKKSSEKEEIGTIFYSWFLLFFILLCIAFLLKESNSFSRLWVLYWFFIGLFQWIILRMVLRFLLRTIVKKGLGRINIGIIGTGSLAKKTHNAIRQSKWTNLYVVGIYNEKFLFDKSDSSNCFKNLLADIENNKIDQVWVALSSTDNKQIQKIISLLDTTTVDIRLVPDVFQLRLLNHSVSIIKGIPVINICMSPMRNTNRIIKAIEDKLIALLILALASPVMLTLAALIKITSKGPIFFLQERVGWNGKKFIMYKFRSMPTNNENNDLIWGKAKNKNKTPIGEFIRTYCLDELPQFINVLKGDMSIVGPRPEQTLFVDQFKHQVPRYMKKHKVKAGITGWAQVNGWKGDTNLNKRIEHDLYYIENWSLSFDIKIIFDTFFSVFFKTKK